MFFKKKRAIGLDIGSSLVKMVELSPGKSPNLVNYGVARILPDAIVDGEIMDREVVLDSIRDLIQSRSFSTKNVIFGVSGHGVIIKRLVMDRMSERETSDQIRWEAEQHIPFDIDEVSIDYEIVNPEFGENQQEVLLVAAKKEFINSWTALLSEVGLNTVAVDATAIALQNVFEYSYQPSETATVALIHMGMATTVINVVRGGVSLLARDIFFGLNNFITRLQRELGLNYEDSVAAMKGALPSGTTKESVGTVFNSFADEIIGQVERSIHFLSSVGGEQKIDKLYLSGGGSLVFNMTELFQRRFDLPTERLRPLTGFEYDPAIFGGEDVDEVGALLAPALGYALRGE
ncbi:hypothetical protein DRP53_03315 [candidate division WOR-3 bacterium]|uniref:SHS2 domain-containing protein n=1 Tax=candidate division WOR-3 bacterium TaxID=2052148 RepID=A0A660SK90_UNCW3|nr:MAG: hypothetical protein DRP53_03315 [candidate division WOR-3 bacterium]